MKKLLLLGLIAIVIIAGCTGQSTGAFLTPKEADISITKIEWYNDDYSDAISYYKSESAPDIGQGFFKNNLYGYFRITIDSNRENLFFKVFDENNNELGYGANEYPYPIQLGERIYDKFFIKLNNIFEDRDIKTCWSYDRNFNINSENKICKTTLLVSPEFKISVIPDSVVFTISKSSFQYEVPYRMISIKNDGSFVVTVCVLPPSYAAFPDYPTYYPQYMTMYGFEHEGGGTMSCETLRPSESKNYQIGPSIGDTPIGAYESTGYVTLAALSLTNKMQDSLVKHPFIMETIVNL